MKKHTIIGTAGHIDHGKTALIKALTSIDTDRLKEEIERGITIDIGFAYWKENVTIIDVPGHERFIKNMVAGVSTIDFFILVIAADDGIMPQTIEHLDILSFFNIHDGIVVINKIDLVDDEWLMLIKEDVENLLKKYKLDNLPIVEVSSIKSTNIDKFKVLVENKIEKHDKSVIERPFRLLVDRSFSVKGFGTVVTGTVLSSILKTGDDIQIFPSGILTKVRGLQEHIKPVKMVEAGDRAAVNLQSISKNTIFRGDVLSKPKTMIVVTEFFGIIRTISNIPIKINNYSRVRLHIGTTECLGQLYWFDDQKNLESEKQFHIRIKLESPVAAARNDAFLIRLHSPVLTLAGGKIVEINPPKIKYIKKDWTEYFSIMSHNDLDKIIETIILYQNFKPVSEEYLQNILFEKSEIIDNSISNLINRKRIRSITFKGINHFIHENNFTSLIDEIQILVTNFHEKSPHTPGLNLQEIIGGIRTKNIVIELVEAALRKMINSKILNLNQNYYCLFDFKIKVSRDTDAAISELLSLLFEAGFEPPQPDNCAELMEISKEEIRSLLKLLTGDKKLIQISSQYYLHIKHWDELISFLYTYFSKNKELGVSHLKEFSKISRKYAIPLLEYLDSANFTRRMGNIREKGSAF